VADERELVGFGQVGELARKELADAVHDPRMDRPAGKPIADFKDGFAEIGRGRRAAIFALQRAAGTEVPGVGTVCERQALWELSELALAEREGDYAWINAATVWGLHSVLDALVEQISPAVAGLVARTGVQEFANQAAAENPELAAQLPARALERVAEAAATVILGSLKMAYGPLGYRGLAKRLDLPKTGPSPCPSVYSFSYGNVGIVSLDANELCWEFGGLTGYSDGAQLRWLEDRLTRWRRDPAIDFIVAFFHECAFSTCNGHSSDGGVRSALAPLFSRHQVDLAIQGHNHVYERTNPLVSTRRPTAPAPASRRDQDRPVGHPAGLRQELRERRLVPGPLRRLRLRRARRHSGPARSAHHDDAPVHQRAGPRAGPRGLHPDRR
jgi:hypothetical protein